MPKHTGRPESGQFSRLDSAGKPWIAEWLALGPFSSIFIKQEVNYSGWHQTVWGAFFS